MRRYVKPSRRLTGVATLGALLVLGCAAPDDGSAAKAESASTPTTVAEAALDDPMLPHGKYLVDNVVLCLNCHSERDWGLYSGPIVPGSEGKGGIVGIFGDETRGPDISPPALAGWTDEDLVASFVDGRDRDGNEIHADWMLPSLGVMTSEDSLAIARYLRTADNSSIAAENQSTETGQARGSYLAAIGRCALCHERDLAGGTEVAVPGNDFLLSANITIDVETGVGRMTRTEFIDYFKSLSGPEFARIEVPPNTANTTMAWPQFSQMTRDDLGAIYDYLASRPAVSKTVPIH